MRATATASPTHKGKRRLLTSCAIAAGMVALAYGGPALAQVAGSGTITTLPAGTTAGTGANPTTVNVTGPQSIVDWTPANTPAGGVIDFLPAGNTLNFVGNAPDYIVLNRFVDGAGTSITDQIGLNGTVNSYVGSTTGPRGGNIWFYNAGGILIGNSGVINVGSLVLTANNIDTVGGLLGPGNTIRFRGAAGTSAITVNGAINANNGNPGGSYVALVAPRVVQAGAVRVDGSVAYVAAEQADIRINSGLFDINVTVGAEGGNAITHTGTTTGPAHQQGDTDQSRIYMVAIPKNDAVTMLVSGAIGYDDALSAQVDPDGAVRLSAGYNIVGGEIAATPANATAANITAGDTLFRSNTVARASAAFVATPTQTLPGSPSPLSSEGQFFVQGNGIFTGDASAAVNIGAGQSGGATGTFTVQSGGRGGLPGSAAVNVTGGSLSAPGALTIRATGTPDAVTGDSQGGTASLTVTGGSVTTSGVTVDANGTSDEGSGGATGNGRGGNAGITVSGTGSSLTAGNIFINAVGRGDNSFVSGPPAINGSGTGGMASLTVSNGGAVGPAALLSIDARGIGGVGTTRSGDGTGGTARIEVTGPGSFLSATQGFVRAQGVGGGDVGPFLSQNGGNGTGGTAEVRINTDATSTIALGSIGVFAVGTGGTASAAENTTGGDALGGTASLTIDGGVDAQFTDITLDASAAAGIATTPSGTTGRSGNARANNVTLAATNGSSVSSSGAINLFAVGSNPYSDTPFPAGNPAGENFGTGTGGTIAVNATAGGTISSGARFRAEARGGSVSDAVRQSAGNGIGGDIDFLADGGTIRADAYNIDVSASTVNVTGTGGTAQGGTIDLFARNGGQMIATLDATSEFSASARTGASAAGTTATGGAIRLIANAGTINLSVGADLSADGVSGGATTSGAGNPAGLGGSVLIRVEADPTDASRISYGQLAASANGQTQSDFGAFPILPAETVGTGRGGTMTVEIEGGTLSGGVTALSADGISGDAAGSIGTGGTARFTQSGGTVDVSDMTVSASGNIVADQSGNGTGGTATIDLLGGTITAADIIARADGQGGTGSTGNDNDPLNIIPGGTGGVGRGGTATINIGGSAVVDASTIIANATGSGGAGGNFNNMSSFSGLPGTPGAGGDGFGGDARVNVTGGTTTAAGLGANASGIGGTGGNSFLSSSSGSATGVGVGGRGGNGRGGNATVALAVPISGVGLAGSIARGTGGDGGAHNVGGNGGDGFGGVAQAIVTGFDAGQLALGLDSTGAGGNGADGRDGNGGSGGNGTGGTSRMRAEGAGANLTVVETNFITGGVGGNGGTGGLSFGSFPAVAPSGGNGGNGRGGTIEVAAADGGAVSIGLVTGDSAVLDSSGRGGNGGAGANSVFGAGNQAGNGGNGGTGNGGGVRLIAAGGTIGSNGDPVAITANGVAGTGGVGGLGQGGGTGGTTGIAGTTAGGHAVIETAAGASGPGTIDLGFTTITANGDVAGRIEVRAAGDIRFAGLEAEARGSAAPTNNDTDTAPAGIFIAPAGGTIASQGDVMLTTDSSVGVHGRSNGIFDVDGVLTISAGDQIDIRHDAREGAAPTVRTSDSLIASAGTSISAAPGSLLSAGDLLSLSATGPTATIGVDRLAGNNIVLSSAGAASAEHAEAAGDFIVTAGSFRTGLNSIITGGNIVVTSPGAVDLGNSTAGGLVQVSGQSIIFNNIDAGLSISLSADGTAPGAEGIRGGSLNAGEDINLFANSIALTGNVTGAASFFAFGTGGAVSVNNADVDGTISVFSAADLTGTFVAGGDVFLNSDADITASARANGGYIDRNGVATQGNLFVDAGGDVTLTDSSAARMFGVNSGGGATITDATAGEDMLVLAATTASLTGVSVGDDLTVQAVGGITADDVSTTGAGADTHILGYSVGSSGGIFTIGVGEGTSGTDGADLVMASSTGAIGAAALSAGDDILLGAAGSIGLNGATTLGLGTTGGDSSIRTQGGATTLAGLDAFSDVIVNAAGLANLTGTVAAGRDATINAQGVALVTLTNPGGFAPPTLSADGNVVVDSSAGITGGGLRAGGDMALTAGAAIAVTEITGNSLALSGTAGIAADRVRSNGFDFDDTISLSSSNGDIRIGDLSASAPIDASANAIRIESGGSLRFTTLTTDVGDAYVRGVFSIENGNIAGTADFATTAEAMNITNLTAANAILLNSTGEINLDTVTVAGNLDVTVLTPGISGASLGITGAVTGQSISLTSANINIAATGRVGTAGTTQQLSIRSNNNGNQTFVGGTGTRNGYHIDAGELTRVYGTQIEIFAPEVQAAGSTSVGSAAPPDVVVDSFTMTGGAPGSNLGANGALTIRTPGKMRVIGNVQLTGLTDVNALNLIANDALEVILGQGSVRLTGANNAPGGQLNMESDDIIVATQAAIAAVGAATSIDAIDARLGENDGVVLDEGALFARGIRADVSGGFYVQNSGAGTDFAQRRGLTFGAGGLDVLTNGPSRIVVNGVQLGPNGQITGLDALRLLTIAGSAPAVGTYDRRSTFNGCFIASPAACTTADFENSFPVQDVIEEEVKGDEDGGRDGNNLPQPLITMRDIDPMTGEPLLDDPVTGAGNDDLWTPPAQ
ncbi:MAG: hypothetical protein J7499_01360 [Sphingopyxis sp.]|nr:hypothetical protein [Sphingopyxis sp.]